MKRSLLLLFFLFTLLRLDGAATVLRLPPMPSPPTIDGRIDEAEWKNASRQFGGISLENRLLSRRKVFFYFGYDDQNLYFAQRSELPRAPLKLADDDTVSITLTPPGGQALTVIFNRGGAKTLPPGARLFSGETATNWESELAIPLATFKLTKVTPGRTWGLQMSRYFRNVAEQSVWHLPDAEHSAGAFIPDPDCAAVSFEGMGRSYPGIQYQIVWRAENPTGVARQLECDAEIVSIENPYTLSRRLELAPGGTASCAFQGEMMMSGIRRTLNARLFDPVSGKVCFQRSFSWDTSRGKAWRNPDPPLLFDFAVYPSFRVVKGRISCADQEKIRSIAEVEFQICDEAGRVVERQAAIRRRRDFHRQWTLPELPAGKYLLRAAITDRSGKKSTRERPFAIRRFAWQDNGIGQERLIVPPFRPLRLEEREVHALQTGYRLAGAFWDEIYAQGENILAAPVRLFINGKEPTAAALRRVEAADDRAEFRTELKAGELAVTSRHEYDYDGMCKVTLSFAPRGQFAFRRMHLDIPLKAEYARLFHATGSTMRRNPSGYLPAKDGVVWCSSDGLPSGIPGFRPYIWFGDVYKGLCWFAESPLHWSRDPQVASQEMIREGDRVTLRIHLVNSAVLRREPFEIVMGFQPTPVKPRPEGYRQMNGHLWGWKPDRCERIMYYGFEKKYAMRLEDGLAEPVNHDWSFVDFIARREDLTPEQVRAACLAFIEKHGLSDENYSRWVRKNSDKLLPSMINGWDLFKGCEWRPRYLNLRAMCPSWPERDVYVDECYVRPWRSAEDYNDEYTCNPNDRYRDLLLFHGRKLLRRGWNGIYYDNVNDITCFDPVLGPAVELGEEQYQPYWPIFSMRELMKRTAVMLTQENMMIAGRPFLMLHMTNVNMVPVNSFAAVTLDWESQFGNKPYPLRFPDDYVLTQTTGTQTGCIPMVIVQASGVEVEERVKSLLAVAFANDLLIQGEAVGLPKPDFFKKAINTVRNFGYGEPDTVVIPGWEHDHPVRSSDPRLRLTVVKRADGKILLLAGNLGEAGEFDVAVEKLGDFARIVNLETGESLGQGTAFRLPLSRYGYGLIELEK